MTAIEVTAVVSLEGIPAMLTNSTRHLPGDLVLLLHPIQVSKARVAFGIKVPATSGNPDFERVFRVQMNTLEWMPLFLLRCGCSDLLSDPIAAGLGLIGSPAASFTDRLFASRQEARTGLCDSGRPLPSCCGWRLGRDLLALIHHEGWVNYGPFVSGQPESLAAGTPCRRHHGELLCSKQGFWTRKAF